MDYIYDQLEEQFTYIFNLDGEYVKLIKNYTLDLYGDLNSILRDNQTQDDLTKKIISDMDEIFDKCPETKETCIVYRGIPEKEFNPTLLSYISTSHDIDIAKLFADNMCILEIEILKGSKILPIEYIACRKKEKEILLHRLGSFTIKNKYYKDGILYYNVTYGN